MLSLRLRDCRVLLPWMRSASGRVLRSLRLFSDRSIVTIGVAVGPKSCQPIRPRHTPRSLLLSGTDAGVDGGWTALARTNGVIGPNLARDMKRCRRHDLSRRSCCAETARRTSREKDAYGADNT